MAVLNNTTTSKKTMEPEGFEPSTFCVPRKCAPNCTTAPIKKRLSRVIPCFLSALRIHIRSALRSFANAQDYFSRYSSGEVNIIIYQLNCQLTKKINNVMILLNSPGCWNWQTIWIQNPVSVRR